MTDILPQPSDEMPIYSPSEDKQNHGLNRQTLWTLVALVVIALICLLIAFIYDYTHNRDQDNTRKQDLSYISTYLNGSYELNHYYPTLDQLNSTTFAAFAPNLDRSRFKDPSASSEKLSEAPTPNSYAYQVAPLNCDNVTIPCTGYELTAVLSDGKNYSVSNPAAKPQPATMGTDDKL